MLGPVIWPDSPANIMDGRKPHTVNAKARASTTPVNPARTARGFKATATNPMQSTAKSSFVEKRAPASINPRSRSDFRCRSARPTTTSRNSSDSSCWYPIARNQAAPFSAPRMTRGLRSADMEVVHLDIQLHEECGSDHERHDEKESNRMRIVPYDIDGHP